MRKRTYARGASVLAVGLLALGLGAGPAHAMKWTRGVVSPYVVDCRSGVVCMRNGQIDWVETCRYFRDQHETFCEAEGL